MWAVVTPEGTFHFLPSLGRYARARYETAAAVSWARLFRLDGWSWHFLEEHGDAPTDALPTFPRDHIPDGTVLM